MSPSAFTSLATRPATGRCSAGRRNTLEEHIRQAKTDSRAVVRAFGDSCSVSILFRDGPSGRKPTSVRKGRCSAAQQNVATQAPSEASVTQTSESPEPPSVNHPSRLVLFCTDSKAEHLSGAPHASRDVTKSILTICQIIFRNDLVDTRRNRFLLNLPQ